MNIDEVIAEFNTRRGKNLNQTDVKEIKKATVELSLTEFELSYEKDGAPIFFKDLGDTMHVHPTMIVANTSFQGSYLSNTYKRWPHQMWLSEGVDKKRIAREGSPVKEVRCPEYFVLVPVGTECQCGVIHFAEPDSDS